MCRHVKYVGKHCPMVTRYVTVPPVWLGTAVLEHWTARLYPLTPPYLSPHRYILFRCVDKPVTAYPVTTNSSIPSLFLLKTHVLFAPYCLLSVIRHPSLTVDAATIFSRALHRRRIIWIVATGVNPGQEWESLHSRTFRVQYAAHRPFLLYRTRSKVVTRLVVLYSSLQSTQPSPNRINVRSFLLLPLFMC